jgi:hypothetical protein
MIRQFGMYPRLYLKKKDSLYPLLEQYSGETMTGKSQGQIIHVYFNLLRNNAEFKTAVDALISQLGSKLLTIQDKISAKKAAAKSKTKSAIGDNQDPVAEETEFIAAISDELKEDAKSQLIQGAILVLVLIGAYYTFKFLTKKRT